MARSAAHLSADGFFDAISGAPLVPRDDAWRQDPMAAFTRRGCPQARGPCRQRGMRDEG